MRKGVWVYQYQMTNYRHVSWPIVKTSAKKKKKNNTRTKLMRIDMQFKVAVCKELELFSYDAQIIGTLCYYFCII